MDSPPVTGGNDAKYAAAKLLSMFEAQLRDGKDMVPEILEWPVTSREDTVPRDRCVPK